MEAKPENLNNRPKFESLLGRLQEIVTSLEKGDLELDDSLKAFEDGVKLTRACESELRQAEQKVSQLVQTETGLEERPLED